MNSRAAIRQKVPPGAALAHRGPWAKLIAGPLGEVDRGAPLRVKIHDFTYRYGCQTVGYTPSKIHCHSIKAY